jgi:hypothetical protein
MFAGLKYGWCLVKDQKYRNWIKRLKNTGISKNKANDFKDFKFEDLVELFDDEAKEMIEIELANVVK